MKSLKTIQTLFKIGKVISEIIFICCIVCFCLCAAGIVSTALGVDGLKIGGVTLKSFIQDETASVSTGTIFANLAAGAVVCAGEAVLSKFAHHYFKRELADGTPFTSDGAREMQRFGILAICIPVGTQIIASIVYSILEMTLSDVAPLEWSFAGSVTIGIMFIVMAQICKYGVELCGQKKQTDQKGEANNG